MIGMVLVTHGALANEFKSALEHVVGPQDMIETVAIGPDDDMEERRNDILSCVDAVDQGSAAWSSSPTCSAAPPPTSPSR
jgi:PTS system mannose-specific IIA component